jgi:maltose O-acetyltransferase
MFSKIKKFLVILKYDIIFLVKIMFAYFPMHDIGSFLRLRYYNFYLKKVGGIGYKARLAFGFLLYNNGKLEIGESFATGPHVTILPGDSFGVIIGNNVSLAHGTYIRASNHNYTEIDKLIMESGHMAKKICTNDGREASVIIENDVICGANTIFLSGAKIGTGTVIAAGSIISSEIPPFSIVVGNPARVVGSRKNFISPKKYFMFE